MAACLSLRRCPHAAQQEQRCDNPIIPVFRTHPKEWKPEPYDRLRGLSIARGYLKFFEPDVYIEAEKGLELSDLKRRKRGAGSIPTF